MTAPLNEYRIPALSRVNGAHFLAIYLGAGYFVWRGENRGQALQPGRGMSKLFSNPQVMW
jgi:hypothetical protein